MPQWQTLAYGYLRTLLTSICCPSCLSFRLNKAYIPRAGHPEHFLLLSSSFLPVILSPFFPVILSTFSLSVILSGAKDPVKQTSFILQSGFFTAFRMTVLVLLSLPDFDPAIHLVTGTLLVSSWILGSKPENDSASKHSLPHIPAIASRGSGHRTN